MVKKVVVAVLICILALPSFVFAESFNSDKLNLPFPPVRDQKKNPDCWSFAATDALEHSMVKKDGADFSREESLFSELHMAAAINRIDKMPYKRFTRSHEAGGNRESAVAYLTGSFASGPVLSSDYTESMHKAYLENSSLYRMLPLFKKRATLTKAQFLTKRDEGSSYALCDDKTGVITYGKRTEIIDKIKKAVKEYGGVAVSYYGYEKGSHNYYNKETASYCVPWEDYINKKTPDGNFVTVSSSGYRFDRASNHTVLIVGWDDEYSHENFKSTPFSFDGEKYTPEDGAWIIKNSWGTDFGDNGYEYISYMEPTICQNATVYDMEKTGEYHAVTHTLRGMMGSVRFPGTAYGVCAVNRFEKEGLINAVGIYVCDTNPYMEILIDTEPGDELKKFTRAQFKEKSETLIDVETGKERKLLKFENNGYYMLYLKAPVYSKGRFDIYVRYTIPEKCDILLPSGNNVGSGEEFVPSVTYWSHLKGSGSVHEWRGIDANWCVNAFMTEEDFETVKASKVKDGFNLRLKRYNKDTGCRVLAVFYKGDMVLAKKSYTPTFDEYGEWKETEKIEGATSVKTFVMKKHFAFTGDKPKISH
ncbi:MAG: C1 family peptidase [Clostridia bacterium]|nr:C1 family peptidase [Clostridia bacterium]